MPVNWYAALVIIVLVGLGSVALAKYNYNQGAPSVEPTTNTVWHAALAFDICGTTQPALPASPAGSTTGLTSSGSGVLVVAPRSASEAGTNATLGKFASGYTGLTLTNTTIQYPHGVLYKNGQRCPKGTPDAGKVGEVPGALVGPVHPDREERRAPGDRWNQHGPTGQPQVRQPPGHHGVLRSGQRDHPQAAFFDRQRAGPDARGERAGRYHDHSPGHGHHTPAAGHDDDVPSAGVFNHDHQARFVVHFDHGQALDHLDDQVAMKG